MSRRAGQLLVVVLMAVALSPSAAQADQSPAGCSSNSLTLRIIRDRPVVRVGEQVTYTVFASNPGNDACDITNASITITTPGPTGAANGTTSTLAQGLDLLGGSGERQIGRVSATITVNNGITDAIASASATGVLHDAPVNHTANITKTLGTTVIVKPGINVTKTGSIVNGVA